MGPWTEKQVLLATKETPESRTECKQFATDGRVLARQTALRRVGLLSAVDQSTLGHGSDTFNLYLEQTEKVRSAPQTL